MQNKQEKLLPSEHNISDLKPGDSKLIQNVHGTYIVVRVPMNKDNSYHEKPNFDKTMKSVEDELDALKSWCDEGENETHEKMLGD